MINILDIMLTSAEKNLRSAVDETISTDEQFSVSLDDNTKEVDHSLRTDQLDR
jgi:hypothetical protein